MNIVDIWSTVVDAAARWNFNDARPARSRFVTIYRKIKLSTRASFMKESVYVQEAPTLSAEEQQGAYGDDVKKRRRDDNAGNEGTS